MSVGTELFATLLVLATIDACLWLPAGAFLFARSWTAWRVHPDPSSLLGNARGSLRFAGGPPVFRGLFVVFEEQFSLGVGGFSAGVIGNSSNDPRLGDEQVYAYGAEQVSSRGNDVYFGHRRLLRTDSPRSAQKTGRILRSLSRLEGKQRSSMIGQWLEHRLAVHRVQQRLARWRRATQRLRLASLASCVLCLVIAPLLWRYAHLGSLWIFSLAFIVGSWAGFEYLASTKQLRRMPGWSERLYAIACALYPPRAFFAWRSTGVTSFAEFDPLAVGYVLLNKEDFESFAARLVRSLKFPWGEASEPNAAAAEYWTLRVGAVRRFLDRLGIDLDRLAGPPAAEFGSLSYCPRCHAQWRVIEAECLPCHRRTEQF